MQYLGFANLSPSAASIISIVCLLISTNHIVVYRCQDRGERRFRTNCIDVGCLQGLEWCCTTANWGWYVFWGCYWHLWNLSTKMISTSCWEKHNKQFSIYSSCVSLSFSAYCKRELHFVLQKIFHILLFYERSPKFSLQLFEFYVITLEAWTNILQLNLLLPFSRCKAWCWSR